MKRVLCCGALALALLAPTGAKAIIPVFDAASFAQILNTVQEMKTTVSTLQQQYDQMMQTYQSFNGTTNMGSLFRNPQLQNMLPSSWQNVYQGIQDGSLSGITGTLQQVQSENSLPGNPSQALGRLNTEQTNTAFDDAAMGNQAYQLEQARLNQIDQLANEVDQTQSPKQYAALRNRIAIQQTRIANEQAKIQLMSMLQKDQDRMMQAQRQQELQKLINPANTGVPSIGQ